MLLAAIGSVASAQELSRESSEVFRKSKMTVSSTRKRRMVASRPVIALIAMIIVLVSARSAYALSCKSELFTLSEAYEAADSIIVALVTECEEEVSSDSWASGGDGCSFVSLEVLTSEERREGNESRIRLASSE